MNGCVQSNLSDVGLLGEMVPLETDDFKYGPVLSSSKISIGSMYRPSDGGIFEDLSVINSFDSVRTHVLLLLFAFSMTFWILLASGKRLLRRNNRISSLWTIVTFFFNEETFELTEIFFLHIFTFNGIIVILFASIFGQFHKD